jgi:hypothetical protein
MCIGHFRETASFKGILDPLREEIKWRNVKYGNQKR